MKIIKCLSEKIAEEIHDADSYVDLAMEWKETEPEAAELFYDLSGEELGHADRLHDVVVNRIKKYRDENGEPPEPMMVLYDYLHEKQIKNSMMVKIKQGMYKE